MSSLSWQLRVAVPKLAIFLTFLTIVAFGCGFPETVKPKALHVVVTQLQLRGGHGAEMSK